MAKYSSDGIERRKLFAPVREHTVSFRSVKLVFLAMLSVSLLIYFPCLRGSFLWDDDVWTRSLVSNYPNASDLGRMWFRPINQGRQYYPLTATSFWIDYHVWRFWTLPYHVENVLLHVLSAVLLWKILQRLEIRGSIFAASIFLVHPMAVESVAWIAERKNVLSLALFLAALLAFGWFANFWKPYSESSGHKKGIRKWLVFALALALFLLAYLAKATVFAFPAVLLLITWWKSRRLRLKEDVLPTLPFFALSLILGLRTSQIEASLGATGAEFKLSLRLYASMPCKSSARCSRPSWYKRSVAACTRLLSW